MSKDVFIQAFSGGDPVFVRAGLVLAIASRFVIEEHDGYVTVRLADGGGDIWGYGDDGGLAVVNATGDEIWNLVVAIAQQAGAAIIPIGGAPYVCDELIIRDLPSETQAGARLVTTGEELRIALGV